MHSFYSFLCWIGFTGFCLAPTELQEDVTLPESLQTASDLCNKVLPYLKEAENASRTLAQITQESLCNPYALSRAGAQGLAQIMPDTLEWGAETFARHLGKPQPHNPRYSVAFMLAYMEYFTVDRFSGYCDNKRVDEMRYNGGFYIIWELDYSRGTFLDAKNICGTRLPNGRKRSKDSCTENYAYSNYIDNHQLKYTQLPGTVCP